MIGTLGDLLRARARIAPGREALVDLASGLRLDYAALDARIDRVAGAMAAEGIGKGDRVAVLLHNGPEFVDALFACARLGAILVPLNWRLTAPEIAFILADAGAETLIFESGFAATVAALKAGEAGDLPVRRLIEVESPSGPAGLGRPYAESLGAGPADSPPAVARVTGEDPLLIVYTSGTTGRPKGVVHSHDTKAAAILNVGLTADMDMRDRNLVVLPLFHIGALTPLTSALTRGVTTVLMRTFDPAAMWDAIERERITVTLAVPAMLNFMLKAPNRDTADRSTLRAILSGAAPVPVTLIEAYRDLGIDIHQVYGMTETCGPGCYIGGEDAVARAGSTGRGYLLTEVRVVDAEGRDLPPGAPGELLVRGPHNMVGYWRRPDATAETLRDGWLHTGDVAIMDAEGFVTIHDRIKDMIISGGENVYPAEVENVLLSHPDVADVAVIGRPSERWGESPFAIVVPAREGVTEGDVLAHCDGRLARFKLPKGVAFVETIPRNPTGKALKRMLRESFPGPAPE